MLERTREQDELDAVVASVPEGRGSTAVIAGPAGIGKTALLDQLRARATEQGLAVLAARGGAEALRRGMEQPELGIRIEFLEVVRELVEVEVAVLRPGAA